MRNTMLVIGRRIEAATFLYPTRQTPMIVISMQRGRKAEPRYDNLLARSASLKVLEIERQRYPPLTMNTEK